MKRLPLDEVALRLLCAMLESGRELQGSASVAEAFALAIRFNEHADMLESQRRRGEVLAFNDDGS